MCIKLILVFCVHWVVPLIVVYLYNNFKNQNNHGLRVYKVNVNIYIYIYIYICVFLKISYQNGTPTTLKISDIIFWLFSRLLQPENAEQFVIFPPKLHHHYFTC